MTVPRSIRDRSVLVDTSAFFAALNGSDKDHAAARTGFETLAEQRRRLVTSNLIAAETYNLIRRALGHAAAIEWLTYLSSIDLLFATERDHWEIVALLARYADKRFSYADACSFVLMERLEIPLAFTFDAHFRQYGLAVMP